MAQQFFQRGVLCKANLHDKWIAKKNGERTDYQCHPCMRAYHRAWRKHDKQAKPAKYQERSKRYRSNIHKRYGKSKPDSARYLEKFKAQGGVCAICQRPERQSWKGKPKRLAEDHCHRTLKWRGLLCTTCNAAIGHFEDSEQLLLAAIAYLRVHQ